MIYKPGDSIRTMGQYVAARNTLKRINKARKKTKLVKYAAFLAEDQERVLAEMQDYKHRKKSKGVTHGNSTGSTDGASEPGT